MRMLMRRHRIANITTWNNINISDTLLHLAFAGLSSSVLSALYIPVKIPTSAGMPDEYTYTRIGYTTTEMADIYETHYSRNFLSVPLIKQQVEGESPYATSLQELTRKIQNIYKLKQGKYMKMAEAMGFEWNPLWNVDGVEKYTSLDNSGVNDTDTTRTYGTHTDSGESTVGGYTDTTSDSNVRTGGETRSGSNSETHEDTNSVTTFDSSEFNNNDHNIGSRAVTGSSETTNYNNVTDTGAGSVIHGSHTDSNSVTYGAHTDTDNKKITHHNATNNGEEYSGGVDGFGNNVTGGDKYHTDIRERHGNIGVTKTTELINDALELYRFNLLQEFFNDINEQLLVGIYDI